MEAPASGHARFGSLLATGPVEVRHDLSGLDSGFWALVVTFEGEVTAVRFVDVDRDTPPPAGGGAWVPLAGEWSTSLDHAAYLDGVGQVRDRIAAGTVYQVNLCRVLSHPLPEDADLDRLAQLLARGNPAPHAGRVHVPEADLDVVLKLWEHRRLPQFGSCQDSLRQRHARVGGRAFLGQ